MKSSVERDGDRFRRLALRMPVDEHEAAGGVAVIGAQAVAAHQAFDDPIGGIGRISLAINQSFAHAELRSLCASRPLTDGRLHYGMHTVPFDRTSFRLLPIRSEKGNAPVVVITGGALNQLTDFWLAFPVRSSR